MAALSLLPVLELEDVPANKLAGTGIFTDAVGRLETARWPKCVFALKLLRLVEFCRLCCSVTIRPFDLRHAFLLDKLKMDKEAIAAEIAQTAGDEKSKDTADALTALVAN